MAFVDIQKKKKKKKKHTDLYIELLRNQKVDCRLQLKFGLKYVWFGATLQRGDRLEG